MNLLFSLMFKKNGSQRFKNMCDISVDLDNEIIGMSLHENNPDFLYIMAKALRDVADALIAESEKPENKKQ